MTNTGKENYETDQLFNFLLSDFKVGFISKRGIMRKKERKKERKKDR